MNKRIGKNDLLLLGVLLCVCIAVLLVFSFDKGKAGATVVVTVDGKEYGRYDLAKEQKVPIYNDQGYASDQRSQGGYDRCRLQGSIVRKTESN